MPWLSWIVSNVLLAFALAMAAWFVQRWLRRPAIAHVLWLLVLVKLVTPPLVSVSLNESSINSACRDGTCSCGPRAVPPARNGLTWVLLAAWLFGAATMGRIAWSRWARFRRLLTGAVPAPAEWQELALRFSTELSLRHVPEILAIPGRLPPLVVPGWRRPLLLLPADLMEQLNGSQRTVLLLHELIHVKRCDHLVRILELVVRVVYWWLPVVSLVGRHLRACEEACCDAGVVSSQPQARRDYARLLLDVVDFVVPPRLDIEQATAMNAAGDLEQRLLAILGSSAQPPKRWPVATLAVALACAIVPCGLRYDLSAAPASPAPEVKSVDQESAPATLPNRDWGNRTGDRVKEMCCPSS